MLIGPEHVFVLQSEKTERCVAISMLQDQVNFLDVIVNAIESYAAEVQGMRLEGSVRYVPSCLLTNLLLSAHPLGVHSPALARTPLSARMLPTG